MSEAASGRGGHAGYSEKGRFYGFGLHAVIDGHGMIVRFAIAAGHESDPLLARSLLNEGERSLVSGDRGYQGCGVYARPKPNALTPRPWWGAMRWIRKTIDTDSVQSVIKMESHHFSNSFPGLRLFLLLLGQNSAAGDACPLPVGSTVIS